MRLGMLMQNGCLTISTRPGRQKRCILARNVKTDKNMGVKFVNLYIGYET